MPFPGVCTVDLGIARPFNNHAVPHCVTREVNCAMSGVISEVIAPVVQQNTSNIGLFVSDGISLDAPRLQRENESRGLGRSRGDERKVRRRLIKFFCQLIPLKARMKMVFACSQAS